MADLREAARQALEALEHAHPKPYNEDIRVHVDAITALRAALEQPEQEPVAMCRTWHKGSDQHAEVLDWTDSLETLSDGEHPLYTHPPRQWQGLTEKEIQSIHDTYHKRMGPQEFAHAVEQALKERNHG